MTSRQRCIDRESKYDVDLSTNRTKAKIVNFLTRKGLKEKAEHIFDNCLIKIKQAEMAKPYDLRMEPVLVIEKALDNIKPLFETKSIRVGGTTQQQPILINDSRGLSLAVKWLVDAAKSRSERGIATKLFSEINDARQGKGNAVKKRVDIITRIEASRSASHFQK